MMECWYITICCGHLGIFHENSIFSIMQESFPWQPSWISRYPGISTGRWAASVSNPNWWCFYLPPCLLSGGKLESWVQDVSLPTGTVQVYQCTIL